MRASQLLLATLKETPADAEVISHKLMLRAGMIRKLAAGLYSWLPLGLRVLRKVENIVRQEMNRAGAQEVLMPAVQPAELWQESARWEKYGPELLRLKDRHKREFCFGPTHEEVITDLIRNDIRSYRQLPATFYQIQTKFRDEIRPRFGVMRAREFLMKDAYSFHVDQNSLSETYQVMHQTYCRIFDRFGLDYRPVHADTGSIGGSVSHEFHVLADSGEDAIAFSSSGEYAANVELVPTLPGKSPRAAGKATLQKIATPGQHSITDISSFLKVTPAQCVKTLLVKGNDSPVVALVLRGDHELNAIKAEKIPAIAQPLRFASEEEVRQHCGCTPGSIGPVGLTIPVLVDHAAAALTDFVCGANSSGHHLTGVNWGRDLVEPNNVDLRNVQEGDPSPDGNGTLQIKRGIEVGHIFQLGKKYSEAMHATVLDEKGQALTMTMGCYGIGVSRVVAAAIEQNNDAKGIIWPDAIAPFQIAIIPMNYQRTDSVRQAADTLYQQLTQAGYDVLLDDRGERAGVMFADCELIGIPHRVVIGDRSLQQGMVEYKHRRDEQPQEVKLAEAVDFLQKKIKT